MMLHTINIDQKCVNKAMAEVLALAYLIQENLDDKSILTYLNKCPSSTEMIGAAMTTLLRQMMHTKCIDKDTLIAIATSANTMSILDDIQVPKNPDAIEKQLNND